METFENKKLIAFTNEEIDNLLACCNAAWLYWEKSPEKHAGVEAMMDMASDYWQKLYHIKVGE